MNEHEYSITAWSRVYSHLKGSPWEDIDGENAPERPSDDPIAAALLYIHALLDKNPRVDAEDAVLATLKAASQHHGWGAFLSVSEVKEMARHFSIHFDDFDEALAQHLEDHYPGTPLEWLNDSGIREVSREVRRDSEIWIDDGNLPGVWVFNKPGYSL